MERKITFQVRTCCIVFFLILADGLAAQQNTLQLEPGNRAAPGQLSDVAWLAGQWRGEGLGGVAEEIWSHPLGGSMMFTFKLVMNGNVQFYEVGYIKEMGSTLVLQLKHFNDSLIGWEEKEKTIDFPLVKIEGNKAYFDSLTYELTQDGSMNVYVVMGNSGDEKEVLFRYSRYNERP